MTKIKKGVSMSHCDFCGEKGDKTPLGKLIEGPGSLINRSCFTPVFICQVCVEQCQKIIDGTVSDIPDDKPLKANVTGSKIVRGLQRQAEALIEAAFQAGYQKGTEEYETAHRRTG